MYYLYNLLVPVVFCILYALHVSGLALLPDLAPHEILFFVIPYLVWSGITSYFKISKLVTVGGSFGLHCSLGLVAYIVLSSNSLEAGNSWFIYLLISPISIAVGAIIGDFASRWCKSA